MYTPQFKKCSILKDVDITYSNSSTPREKRISYMESMGYTKLTSNEREARLVNAIRYMQKIMSS
jgi:hypothetical protein